ncbi:MAG: UDP-N-acetylmuramoyl-tripeptide--D-alanyl-D-alanine ligase [Treponema sp.]|nr:UDP-N-acetylmuramoyl-tripeptide--D-alanyl-D-alanine ligase [Treponema sp.]
MADTESLENISSLLNLSETLEAVGGVLLCDFAEENFCFTSVATDSRKVTEKTLFVPLIGEFQDGHSYVPQAVGAGASAVFISKYADVKILAELKIFAQNHKNVAFILVENTLRALQKAAEAYVGKFPSLIRCAITGSSGKTTTKEIALSVLRQKFCVVATEGNFNSETGLPLSVFRIRKQHELGLFEMGMNRENEIKEIAEVFKPEFAVITNIGTAHIGILGSRENIAKEKKNIFSYIDEKGAAFIPENDDFADFLSEGVKGDVVFYGENSDKNVKFVRDEGLEGTVFSVDGVEMRLPLPGHYNFLNALAAVEMAKNLGLDANEIKRGIESIKPLGGRSQIRKGKFTILEDCYNANPDSMEKAIELCAGVSSNVSAGSSASVSTSVHGGENQKKCKKIFVLGDMLELGALSKAEHEKVGVLALKSGADLVVLVGDEMNAAFEKAKDILSEKGDLAEQNVLPNDDFSENGDSLENNCCARNDSESLEKSPKIDVLKSKSSGNNSGKKSEIKIVHISGKDENSIKAAAKEIKKVADFGDLILLKGSRGIGLERLIPLLEGENASGKNADDAVAGDKNDKNPAAREKIAENGASDKKAKNSENAKNAGARK